LGGWGGGGVWLWVFWGGGGVVPVGGDPLTTTPPSPTPLEKERAGRLQVRDRTRKDSKNDTRTRKE